MNWETLKTWKERFGKKGGFMLVLILVGVLSFEAGALLDASTHESPLVIRSPAIVPPTQPVEKKEDVPVGILREDTTKIDSSSSMTTCAFVGSKKSNKYHLPTSRCAKQIKKENLVCFDNVEAAVKKGYQPGCLE